MNWIRPKNPRMSTGKEGWLQIQPSGCMGSCMSRIVPSKCSPAPWMKWQESPWLNIICTHFSVLMSEDNIINMLLKSLAFYKALMSNTFIGNANVYSKKKIRFVDVAFSSMFIFSILHAFYLLCSCLPPYYSLLPFTLQISCTLQKNLWLDSKG